MPRAIPRMEELPPILAAPLAEYAHEGDVRLALWHACDVVEMSLRLSVALGLGDWARAGGVPAALRGEVARRLEQPTLGRWRGMALAVAASPPPGTPLADLWTWVVATLEPLLVAGDPFTSLTELRNRLAHGGGVGHGLASDLMAAWEPRLRVAFGALSTLADLRLVAPTAGVVLGADDAVARGRAAAWAEARSLPDDAVVAVRGDHVLPLWPLVSYSSPTGEPRAVPQVYVRRGEVRLVMTPLGAERAAVAESSAAAVDALLGAGLLGDPPPKPPVELEVPGFEAEIKRDAGSCVGREAEVAAVVAAVGGKPGLTWVFGPAGSGKSLVLARAIHGQPCISFRFKAGDARCTRDTFLRFVVERAAQAANTAPAKGKPLREQAKQLLAAAPVPIVVDGIEDVAGIDPPFVADVLAPLARVTRIVAASRQDAAVAAAMRTAGAEDLFADGLPAMTPADVRAMLLDKIGPLSKRLVALDRDAGADVVNPFVEAVVGRAGGLPVYVAYVIGDLLAGRIRTLDATGLPPSLGAYHAAVLRRGGAGAAQQLITPLVATLALLHESLETPALHALLVHRVLATDDDAGRTALDDALAQLAGMLRREDRDANGLPEYALFHPTLRDHVLAAPEQAMAVATARIALGRAARDLDTGPVARYLDDHGVAHLVEAGDLAGAAAALAWPRLLARLARGAAVLPGVLGDLRRVADAAPRQLAGGVPVADLHAFVRGAAHHIERGGMIALVQAALAEGDDSPITAAAEREPPRPGTMGRVDRPARAVRGARQRTMVGHAAGIRGLVVAGATIVSASADGTLRAWDADDGSALRTLAPPMTSMSSTTRATPSAAPEDVAGKMPVLGIHAVCALPGGAVVVAAHGDGVVRAWQLDTGAIVAEARIRTYAWAIAPLPGRVAIACDDGVLRILDARTLAAVAEARPAAATSGTGSPHLVAVAAVRGVLVVGGASRGLGILDPTSLTPLGELRADAPPRALAAVPDSVHLLSTHRDGSLALWDVAERRLIARVDVPGGALSVVATATTALVGTRAGSLVRVRLPDLAILRTAAVHAGGAAAVVALADGRAVSGGDDKAVRMVDLEVAAAARPSHAGAIAALSAPSPVFAVTGGADGAVKIWDAVRGRSLRTVPAHPGGVAAVTAHALPDGVVAFSAAGTTVAEHRLTATGTVASTPMPPSPSPIVALAARSADELVAACLDGGVRTWTRAAGWHEPAARHDGAAFAIALWGARVVSGGADGLVRISGVDPAIWRAHTWDVHAVAAAAETVVSAGRDGSVIVWDVATGVPRLIVQRHGGAPRCLAVSPDGTRIASATRDDCIVIWSPAGDELARWTCDAPPHGLVFADARTLVVGDAAGEIAVLRLA